MIGISVIGWTTVPQLLFNGLLFNGYLMDWNPSATKYLTICHIWVYIVLPLFGLETQKSLLESLMTTKVITTKSFPVILESEKILWTILFSILILQLKNWVYYKVVISFTISFIWSNNKSSHMFCINYKM